MRWSNPYVLAIVRRRNRKCLRPARLRVLLLMLIFFPRWPGAVSWPTEEKQVKAASEIEIAIREIAMRRLGRDFISVTKKLDARDRALGAEDIVSCWRTEYRSKEPYERQTHIRIYLVECAYSTEVAAKAGFKRFLATAHPDSGHSYEWETVSVAGSRVFRLVAGCIISRANFNRISDDLTAALESKIGNVAASARCRCGGGCAEGFATDQKAPK